MHLDLLEHNKDNKDNKDHQDNQDNKELNNLQLKYFQEIVFNVHLDPKLVWQQMFPKLVKMDISFNKLILHVKYVHQTL